MFQIQVFLIILFIIQQRKLKCSHQCNKPVQSQIGVLWTLYAFLCSSSLFCFFLKLNRKGAHKHKLFGGFAFAFRLILIITYKHTCLLFRKQQITSFCSNVFEWIYWIWGIINLLIVYGAFFFHNTFVISFT